MLTNSDIEIRVKAFDDFLAARNKSTQTRKIYGQLLEQILYKFLTGQNTNGSFYDDVRPSKMHLIKATWKSYSLMRKFMGQQTAALPKIEKPPEKLFKRDEEIQMLFWACCGFSCSDLINLTYDKFASNNGRITYLYYKKIVNIPRNLLPLLFIASGLAHGDLTDAQGKTKRDSVAIPTVPGTDMSYDADVLSKLRKYVWKKLNVYDLDFGKVLKIPHPEMLVVEPEGSHRQARMDLLLDLEQKRSQFRFSP